jgi:phosphonate transport system substrate-binding protein
MSYEKIFPILLLAFAMLLSACQGSSTTATQASPIPPTDLTRGQIIIIGFVSDDPAGEIETGQPFADYLASQLADLGILQGQILVTPDFDSMVEKLQNGEVDLFYESPYGALYAYEYANAIPLLRGWRRGVSEYNSGIFVRKDSGITSLNDLQGKLVGFSEPDSTTGYHLPRAYLITNGLVLSQQSSEITIPSGETGYTITGSSRNMFSALLLGRVSAGAEQTSNYESLSPEEKDQLIILAQTPMIPRSMLMASDKLNSALLRRITDVLLNAKNSEEGLAALNAFKRTTEFDNLPLGPEGTMQALKDIFR